MRNKALLTLIMFLVLGLVGCNFITPPTPELVELVDVLSADVIVIDWVQEASNGGFEKVISIDYLITNTGTVDIDFSRVLFKVTYEEKTKATHITDWIDGEGVDVGCYEIVELTGVTGVWVGDKEVSDVVAIDWELASYEL